MIWSLVALLLFGVWSAFSAGPLWEPPWSPFLLAPGEVDYPAVDSPDSLCPCRPRSERDPHLIAAGDFLHALHFSRERVSEDYAYLEDKDGNRYGPGYGAFRAEFLWCGDVDRDGDADLIALQGRKLWVFLKGGWSYYYPSLFSPLELPVSPLEVWLVDHGRDGAPEAFVAHEAGVLLVRNTPAGGFLDFQPLAGIEVPPTGAVSGSLTGRLGTFVLTPESLHFFPRFSPVGEVALGVGGEGLYALELDGSPGREILLIREGELVFLGEGPQGLGEVLREEVPRDAEGLWIGDLEGDGLSELIFGLQGGWVGVRYNVGGRFSRLYRFGVVGMGGLPPGYVSELVVGDFTGNGADDLVAVAFPYHLAFLTGERWGASRQPAPGSFLLGEVDLEGDGFSEVLLSTAEGGIAVLEGEGGLLRHRELLPASKGDPSSLVGRRMPYLAEVVDWEGDGVRELLVWEFAREGIYQRDPEEPWRWVLAEESKANLTLWDLQAREVRWSLPTGEAVRPVLFFFDLDGDGLREMGTVVGEELVGFRPRKVGTEYGTYYLDPGRVEVHWGGAVGPVSLWRTPGGEVLAGFLLEPERVRLLLMWPGGEPRDTGISLEFAPLDLMAADLDRDGVDELVSVGWGVVEGELCQVVVLVRWGEGGPEAEEVAIPDWPPLSLPFPYGGLTAGDLDGDGDWDLAAMRLPDREGHPGGVVVLPWEEEGVGRAVFLAGCSGTKLLALDVDGDGAEELLTVALGVPARLCLSSWR